MQQYATKLTNHIPEMDIGSIVSCAYDRLILFRNITPAILVNMEKEKDIEMCTSRIESFLNTYTMLENTYLKTPQAFENNDAIRYAQVFEEICVMFRKKYDKNPHIKRCLDDLKRKNIKAEILIR